MKKALKFMIVLGIISALWFANTARTIATVNQSIPELNVPAQKVEALSIDKTPQDSGYVDENGRPLSIEEHNRLVDENTGVQWDHVLELLAVIVIIIAIIVVMKKKKRLANKVSMPIEASQPLQQPVQNQIQKPPLINPSASTQNQPFPGQTPKPIQQSVDSSQIGYVPSATPESYDQNPQHNSPVDSDVGERQFPK